MAILYGVGVGPGDPELMTLKAVRVIRECDVIAVPGEDKEDSVAYRIAIEAIPDMLNKQIICIPMPMTKDEIRLQKSHEAGAKQIMAYLKQGKSVAFLTLGDPTVYSTYLYIHRLVKQSGYQTEIVNGIASFLAASAVLQMGLVEKDQQLHIIPSSYDVTDALELPGTKVFMKAGRNMPSVKEAIKGMNSDIYMVENCGMKNQRICQGVEEIPDDAGYYSLVIVK